MLALSVVEVLAASVVVVVAELDEIEEADFPSIVSCNGAPDINGTAGISTGSLTVCSGKYAAVILVTGSVF